MYDIKAVESGEKVVNDIVANYCCQKNHINQNNNNSCSNNILSQTTTKAATPSTTCLETTKLSPSPPTPVTKSLSEITMPFRRRRIFQRQACLLSVMAAFSLGLVLGVFIPMIGMSAAFTSDFFISDRNKTVTPSESISSPLSNSDDEFASSKFMEIDYRLRQTVDQQQQQQQPSDLDQTINSFSVSFVKEKELPAEEVFRNAFHLEQDKINSDTMIVKKLDAHDGSIKEFKVQRTSDGLFRKGPERRLSKPSVAEQVLALPKFTDDSNFRIGDSAITIDNDAPNYGDHISVEFVPINKDHPLHGIKKKKRKHPHNEAIIKDDIYWGNLIEKSLPKGFGSDDAIKWNKYVQTGIVTHLENGCGRMQNRLVIFNDGTRACARYRQNTDQIQGELFSFYLGQLLNLTNLAPSTASVIDLDTMIWSSAIQDITAAQWKSSRPVVLTKWLPDLEPAGIPAPFQPLERHLNKFDVWNITLGSINSSSSHSNNNNNNINRSNMNSIVDDTTAIKLPQKGLLDRLGAIDDQSKRRSADIMSIAVGSLGSFPATNDDHVADDDQHDQKKQQNHKFYTGYEQHHHTDQHNDDGTDDHNDAAADDDDDNDDHDKDRSINSTILNRLVELAQWSDLIVFDYLIANLDRVVNNLYNYQWNADIMAAPAHNLARQTNSQLLVFLDNESGLLHGYRLLKKYEAYHGLLLDNLCIFRQPTIKALQQLRDSGAGKQLQQIFEKSTSHQVRDVLPSLPDKSIKILIDRIDRVLGQVQKCRDLFSDSR